MFALVAVLMWGCHTVKTPISIPTKLYPPGYSTIAPQTNVVQNRMALAAVIIPTKHVTVMAEVEPVFIKGFNWTLYTSSNANFSNKVMVSSQVATTNGGTIQFTVPALAGQGFYRIEGTFPP